MSISLNIYACAAMMCMAISVSAHNNQELFLQAGDLYAQGAYQDALATYAKIDSQGAAVWFNRALTDAQLGNMVSAQLNMLRALKHAPSFGVYRTIAQQYRQLRADNAVPTRSETWYSFGVAVSRGHSLLSLQLLVLALLFLCGVLWFFGRRYWWALVLTFVCASLLTVAWYDRQARVFVHQNEVPMRAGQNDSFSVVATLHQTDTARVERVQADWLQLVHTGIRGWVRAHDVVII